MRDKGKFFVSCMTLTLSGKQTLEGGAQSAALSRGLSHGWAEKGWAPVSSLANSWQGGGRTCRAEAAKNLLPALVSKKTDIPGEAIGGDLGYPEKQNGNGTSES